MKPPYAGYHVLSKWDSASFDDTTRAVLDARLHRIPPRRFFSEAEWALVDALGARLLPQAERREPIPLTPWIDAALFDGRGEGYRREGVPTAPQAWRAGLAAIEAEARARHDLPFADLDEARQDALLTALAAGAIRHPGWGALDPAHFFRELLLKTMAGIYYAHPDAWNEIGFGGPASPRGYVRLGFDQRDAWEAP